MNLNRVLKFSRLGRAANQRVAILAETSRCFIDIATQQIDKSVAVANGHTNERLSNSVPIAAPKNIRSTSAGAQLLGLDSLCPVGCGLMLRGRL